MKPTIASGHARTPNLSGGPRTQASSRATARTPLSSDRKGEYENFVEEMKQQRQSYEKEVRDLKEQLDKSQNAARMHQARQDQMREEKLEELESREKSTAESNTLIAKLQNQIEQEQRQREGAESKSALALKKARLLQKQYERLAQETQVTRQQPDVLNAQDPDQQRHRPVVLAAPQNELIRSLEAEVEEGRNQVRSLRNAISASNVQMSSLQENLDIAQDTASSNSAKMKSLQDALNSKEQEAEELREGIDSAKDTIISQNEHMAQQDNSMRQLKKRLQIKEKEHSKQMDSLQRENDKLHVQMQRLQAKLQEKEAEEQEKMMSTQHRIEELQKQADQADDLMGTLAGSRQKMSKLAGERNSHAAAALSARQALEDSEKALTSLKHQLRDFSKREQAVKKRLRLLQKELDLANRHQAEAVDQIQELTDELDALNERWDREQAKLKKTQRMHNEEEKGMSREIHELTAITEQLREDLRVVQQLKLEAATRQKLSETQCKRLNERQKASEGKIKELKGQLTEMTLQQQRDQEDRAQLVSELASTIQAEEAAKLAAQREARVIRQKLAHVEVKLLETTNAKTRAEMMCQKVEADAASLRRSQRKQTSDAYNLQEPDDDLRGWLNKSDSSASNWLPSLPTR